MKVECLIALLCFFTVGDGLFDPVTRIARPHVETYWESWDGPGNFVSELSDVPVTTIGSSTGVNIVNLAFANNDYQDDYECLASPNCITAGFEMYDSAKLHETVNAIHEAGGFVKMAFGGETYGNPSAPMDMVDLLVNRIVNLIDEYDLDGIDLTTVRDCGNAECSYTESQIELIHRLRVFMPNKIISYTFPSHPKSSTYSKVINATMYDVDYFMMSWGTQGYVNDMIAMNVPKYKIVWGQIIGILDCDMSKTVEAAEAVAAEKYGGVVTWSINSDTYERNDEPEGICTGFQSGHPDAAYVNTISYILNH